MKNIRPLNDHLRYLKYVLRHKWYVLLAGRKLGCGWFQLLAHDASKFSKAEWTPYVNNFIRKIGNKTEFFKALNHHWENNPHHAQFWVDPITDRCHPIPIYFLREMVADWIGAGRAQNKGKSDVIEWYTKNRNKIPLHPITRDIVETLIPGYLDQTLLNEKVTV